MFAQGTADVHVAWLAALKQLFAGAFVLMWARLSTMVAADVCQAAVSCAHESAVLPKAVLGLSLPNGCCLSLYTFTLFALASGY